jgi:hypothetical protein
VNGRFLALVLAFTGCAAVQSGPSPAPRAEVTHQGEEPVAQARERFLELSSRRVLNAPPAGGLFVRGTEENGVFLPQGDVQGEGPLGEAGQPGWLELGPRQFQPDRTARPPFPPYLKGFLTPQGEFRPASRTVVYQ